MITIHLHIITKIRSLYSTMAVKLCLIMFSVVIMTLHLLEENHAAIITEAPTPQPHQISPFPMHGITQGSLQPQECSPRCTQRCSKTAFKKPCMFFCQKCCAKCLCVPPGTYGNKEFCPCYNNWKTKRGGPKCP
ncbi:protein GAST1 [Castanea sativa]|uniref:protein GAST1 n=1 Tax=Castanea sativa TaxID=21020 RepID=UPI003F6504E2